jgi:hypothetical protein
MGVAPGDKAITAIVPSSPQNGLTFQTPVRNYQPPYIPVQLNSIATGTGGTVCYVIGALTDPGFRTDDGGRPYWTGLTNQYTSPVPPPAFPGAFDLGAMVRATPGLTQYAFNALSVYSISVGLGGTPTYIYYTVASYPVKQVQVNLDAVTNTTDANSNALPDSVFASSAGGAWVANCNLDPNGIPEVRGVVVRDLRITGGKRDKATGDTIVIPVSTTVTVEVPSAVALFNAGAIASSTDSVVAVVTLTDDLAGAVDSVNGGLTGQNARQQWATATLADAPGKVVPGCPVVQIAFVASVGGQPVQLRDCA